MDHLVLMSKMGFAAMWCAGSEEAIDTIDSYIKNGDLGKLLNGS